MPTPQKKILYVEDEPFFAKTLDRTLTAAGYEVVLAKDGQEALDLLSKESLPDLVLLDLVLPKVDGKAVLGALKADPRTAHIPVIVLSNLSSAEDQDETQKLGASKYLVKAMSLPSDIVQEVKAFC